MTDGRPLLRVVNGDATPEEVAALVAVSACAAARGRRPRRGGRRRGAAHHRKLRVTHPHGPGGLACQRAAEVRRLRRRLLGWRRDDDRAGRRPVQTATSRSTPRSTRCTATYAGIAGHDHGLTDLSPEGFVAREEAARRALERCGRPIRSTTGRQVARDAFLERVGLDVETAEAGYGRGEISVISSWAHTIRESFDLMPTDTEEGWANIAAPARRHPRRHGRLPQDPRRARPTPDAWSRCGSTPRSPARSAAGPARRARAATSSPTSSPTAPEATPRRAVAARRRRQRGVRRARRAAWRPSSRRAVATARPRAASGTPLASRDVPRGGRRPRGDLRLGLGGAEAASTDDMVAASNRIVPGGSVDDAVAALDADPARRLGSREEFRDWMQQLADAPSRTSPTCTSTSPSRSAGSSAAWRRPTTAASTTRARARTSPGRGGCGGRCPTASTRFSTWREVTTVYHEGVPGHHLQVAQTVFRSDLLNRWQRAAVLGVRPRRGLGALHRAADGRARLPRGPGQPARHARHAGRSGRLGSIVDIGMHLELEVPRDNPFGWRPGERWTPELVSEFMRLHSRDGRRDARLRGRRATSAGRARRRRTRSASGSGCRRATDAQARHGDDFDLSAFHRAALDLGSIGLDPLRSALAKL